jgi:radical SAM protein with 4Fe4S-binding SPASM domain
MREKPEIVSLIFEITQRCNHACLYCYNVWDDGDYPRGELDPARTLLLLGKALDETVCRHVTLTGGEPLLRSDLPAVLDYLTQRGVASTLVTNGRQLDEPTAMDLLARGTGLFELPLLSHQRELHDQLCGTPGAYDSVLAAMANLRLHRGKFAAVFVATRLNIPDLYDTVQLAYAFGARGVMLNRFNPGGRGRTHRGELMPSTNQLTEALAVADAASEEFGLPISLGVPIQPCVIDLRQFSRLKAAYCGAGREHAYYTLDPLGNLRPCNHSSTVLGSLFDVSFARLIDSEPMKEFRAAVPASCAECESGWECQGGCKASAQVCCGSLAAEEPFLRQHRERPSID